MIKFRTPLNILMGRIRYGLARIRKRVIEICELTPGHWRWASIAVLIILGLFMAGMGLDFIGKLHIGIFLLALVFYLVLPLLAGLGARLGLRILNLLAPRFSWIYFGAVFFVFSLFGSTGKAKLILSLFLVLSGAFLGAGLYNIGDGRWEILSKIRRVLTVVFLFLGASLFIFGWFILLYPGKAPEEVKVWAMDSKHLPAHLKANDPSLPGTYQIDSLTYGWGKKKPRPMFGPEVDLFTSAVDGSSFLDGWDKLSGKLRSHYWKMGPDSLALNAQLWYPLGEGPFPLVLMVHGNHLDRDFSDPGYAYLGRHFASHGIIAVTVDENFLNGAWSDFSSGLETETDCRGWLLLKHLELWRDWNSSDSSLFFEKVDMDRIVLIGHSRGGEAVSVASCFNKLPYYPDNARQQFDFNFGIRGIAAIAPVDGQYWPGGIATPVDDVNYFTIHGSIDGDVRSFDGQRQMRRVRFTDSTYHFAAGLYLHGANHGQFNTSWGIFDHGYPQNMLLNRRAIIPVEQQEKVALVYLTAFVMESFHPGSGYLSLFKDYRSGQRWLPDLVHLNQFHESMAVILCNYEEDLDLSTGSRAIDSIGADGLALWKEGRIPKKWGDQRNNGVFLGWNNEKDSVPGYYQLHLDSTCMEALEGNTLLTFLAADAQVDPGERMDTTKADAKPANAKSKVKKGESKAKKGESIDEGKGGDEDKGDKEDKEDKEEDEEPVPVDFNIVLSDSAGREFRVRLGDHLKLQPPIKPQVFKSGLFHDDPESEVILQYIAIPLEAFLNAQEENICVQAIRSIRFEFDAEKKGSVIIDQLGFTSE